MLLICSSNCKQQLPTYVNYEGKIPESDQVACVKAWCLAQMPQSDRGIAVNDRDQRSCPFAKPVRFPLKTRHLRSARKPRRRTPALPGWKAGEQPTAADVAFDVDVEMAVAAKGASGNVLPLFIATAPRL